MNKILARKILRQFKMQNIVYKQSRMRSTAFYIGGGLSMSQKQFKTFTFDILLTRKTNAYSLGFGIDNNFHYVWRGSIFFKL